MVGIGASAGGLEALRGLFAGMPADSGLAFVVVSHLAPDVRSLLAELLAQQTPMQVGVATDGVEVEADHVYVVPPGRVLDIHLGKLRVTKPDEGGRPHHPIDTFLRALAGDRGDRSACIILSGAGADGSLGIQAIKEVGGLVIAQDETTALHPEMPRAAIDTGLVDYVLPVEHMPRELIRYMRDMGRASPLEAEDGRTLAKLFVLLRDRTRHDFSHYKQSTIQRRIDRRMRLVRVETLPKYVELLRSSPAEIDALARDFLIGVTHFFRDPEAFDALESVVVPRLFVGRETGTPIRVWVPGCATGEEAYSIAMLLAEHAATADGPVPIQIFATDIDESSLDKARAGVYPATIAADVGRERLDRFFVRRGDGYQVAKHLRETIVFSAHDLTRDAPFSRLDLVSCRNVLIYFAADLQKRLIPLFHYALNERGVLFLGGSETIGTFTNLFSPIDKRHRIYARLAAPARRTPTTFPLAPIHRGMPAVAEGAGPKAPAGQALTRMAERVLLERYAPAAVVVDPDGDIVHFHGHTGIYLESPPGSPDLNAVRMARRGLRTELRRALEEAARQHRKVVRDHVRVWTDGGTTLVTITVTPLGDPERGSRELLVAFEPFPSADGGGAPAEPAERQVVAPRERDTEDPLIQQFEGEIAQLREALQTTTEEYETQSEELKSSNEELLSTNEELQSTNEELETSREELQSVNEELQTLNAELNAKVEELGRLNSDIRNLLDSTHIATVFLDNDLRIKSFTPALGEIFRVIPGDVGRPISDLRSKIAEDLVVAEMRNTLRTLATTEREIDADDGRSYVMRVAPYRTVENVIEGVVLTFIDVTDLKAGDLAMRRLAAISLHSNDAVTLQDLDGTILAWNRGAERLYGYGEPEALHRHFTFMVPDDRRQEVEELRRRLLAGETIEGAETERLTRAGTRRPVAVTLTLIRDDRGTPQSIATIERDLAELRKREQRFEALVEAGPDAIIAVGENGEIALVNQRAEAMFGWSRREMLGRPVEMLIPERFRARHERHRHAYMATPSVRPMGAGMELHALRKDGTEVPVEISLSPLAVEGGTLVLSAVRDVTALRRIEQELREAKALLERRVEKGTASLVAATRKLRSEVDEHRRTADALGASEDLRSSILASMTARMAVLDRSGRIIAVNPAWEAAATQGPGHGRPGVGTSFLEACERGAFGPLDETMAEALAAVRAVLAGERDEAMMEQPWDGPEGRQWFLMHATPLGRPGGGLVLSYLDVTKRKEAEAQVAILEKLSQRRERLAEVGALMAKVVHDLGNPVAALMMQTQLMLRRIERGEVSPDLMGSSARRVLATAERLDGLVKEFLTVAREPKPDLTDGVSLPRICAELVEGWRPLAASRGVELALETADGFPTIRADPGKIERVVENVLKNAIEAIGDAPGRVAFTLTVPDPGKVRIAIEDSGPGIPPGMDVFAPFETTKSEGTGLGMVIAKQFTEAHRGRIAHASAPHGGTVFTIELPIQGP